MYEFIKKLMLSSTYGIDKHFGENAINSQILFAAITGVLAIAFIVIFLTAAIRSKSTLFIAFIVFWSVIAAIVPFGNLFGHFTDVNYVKTYNFNNGYVKEYKLTTDFSMFYAPRSKEYLYKVYKLNDDKFATSKHSYNYISHERVTPRASVINDKQ